MPSARCSNDLPTFPDGGRTVWPRARFEHDSRIMDSYGP